MEGQAVRGGGRKAGERKVMADKWGRREAPQHQEAHSLRPNGLQSLEEAVLVEGLETGLCGQGAEAEGT